MDIPTWNKMMLCSYHEIKQVFFKNFCIKYEFSPLV